MAALRKEISTANIMANSDNGRITIALNGSFEEVMTLITHMVIGIAENVEAEPALIAQSIEVAINEFGDELMEEQANGVKVDGCS